MNQSIKLCSAFVLFIISLSAAAHDYNNIKWQCLDGALGAKMCAPHKLGATIRQDELGNFACSVGECAKDPLGNLKCSAVANGKVIKNQLGDVKCEGGCVAPEQSLCVKADDIFK